MEEPAVLLTMEGPIAHLTLNRPDRHNSLGLSMVGALTAAVRELHRHAELRCAVVSGAGRSFCSGADLKERVNMDLPAVRRFVTEMRDAMTALAELPFPTVAAVHGLALGGGCELALACDIRLIHSQARIGLTEVGWAVIPGAGGTQRLPRLIGEGKAKELIFTGAQLSGAEAVGIGLCNQVLEGADPRAAVLSAADEMAGRITRMAPMAVRQAKRAINYGRGTHHLADGLAFEWQCYEAILPTKDRLEGLAAFAEKRPPEYKGE